MEDNEIVIHDEGNDHSYPNFSIPVIEDSCGGINTHMVEITKSYFVDTTQKVPMPLVYKMLAMTMLRSSF